MLQIDDGLHFSYILRPLLDTVYEPPPSRNSLALAVIYPSVAPIVKQVIEILPGVVLGVLTPRFPTYLGKLRSYVP